MRLERTHVAAAQGAVFLANGLRPVVSPKRARQGSLVKTVGLLVASVGAGLALAAARRDVSDETALVGALSAGALLAIDLVYDGARRRSPLRLADALLQACWVGGWLATARQRRELTPSSSIDRWRPLLGQ
jgi:hypothetical protein